MTSQKIASISEDATPVRKRMSIIALFFMFYVGVTQQKQILGNIFTGPSQGPSVSVGRPAAIREVRNDLIKSDPLIPPTKMKTVLSIVCLDHYANALFVHLMACFASLSVG